MQRPHVCSFSLGAIQPWDSIFSRLSCDPSGQHCYTPLHRNGMAISQSNGLTVPLLTTPDSATKTKVQTGPCTFTVTHTRSHSNLTTHKTGESLSSFPSEEGIAQGASGSLCDMVATHSERKLRTSLTWPLKVTADTAYNRSSQQSPKEN